MVDAERAVAKEVGIDARLNYTCSSFYGVVSVRYTLNPVYFSLYICVSSIGVGYDVIGL